MGTVQIVPMVYPFCEIEYPLYDTSPQLILLSCGCLGLQIYFWEITDTVFQAIEFDHKSLFINGSTFPIVPLTCNNCGNTYFINALVAKLIDPQEQSQNDNSKANEKELGDCNE